MTTKVRKWLLITALIAVVACGALYLAIRLVIYGLALCGLEFGPNMDNTIAHFNANYSSIEAFAEYYRSNSGIDYVEFKKNGNVDMFVIDRKSFNSNSPMVVFKYKCYDVPINSTVVSNALEYASVPNKTLMHLKKCAADSGCISISKPYWDSSPVKVEIGYARDLLSKWKFCKLKSGMTISNVISQCYRQDDHPYSLTNNWILTFESGACN